MAFFSMLHCRPPPLLRDCEVLPRLYATCSRIHRSVRWSAAWFPLCFGQGRCGYLLQKVAVQRISRNEPCYQRTDKQVICHVYLMRHESDMRHAILQSSSAINIPSNSPSNTIIVQTSMISQDMFG